MWFFLIFSNILVPVFRRHFYTSLSSPSWRDHLFRQASLFTQVSWHKVITKKDEKATKHVIKKGNGERKSSFLSHTSTHTFQSPGGISCSQLSCRERQADITDGERERELKLEEEVVWSHTQKYSSHMHCWNWRAAQTVHCRSKPQTHNNTVSQRRVSSTAHKMHCTVCDFYSHYGNFCDSKYTCDLTEQSEWIQQRESV